MTDLGDRFWSKTEPGEDGCVVWTAGKSTDGYGQFSVNGTNKQAHRLAYESVNGPIPEGLEASHLCHNRACVNPEHLVAETSSKNNRRKAAHAECHRCGVLFRRNTLFLSVGNLVCWGCYRENVIRNYRQRRGLI